MDYQTLQDEIKSAMKAHDNNRRDILRQVHTELKAIEVNARWLDQSGQQPRTHRYTH